jgi:hypothetical protein
MDSIGESYEVFAESVLGRIATLTRVGTKQDFGTDTYCQPRVPAGDRTEMVTELCLIQIKGGTSPLSYGGMDKDGRWRSYELQWLRDLWAPLFLATVDREYRRVDLFSLWPIWWVMWQCGSPFKVECRWREAADAHVSFANPTREHSGTAGDGNVWRVDLGPPLLQLSHENLNDDEFARKAVDILRLWIQVDRRTVARFHGRVPYVEAHHTWQTNEFPTASQSLLAWDPTPGRNIDDLARAFVPSLVGLGVHLQWQGNSDAYRLIPILDWVDSNGYGNEFVKGLLDGLLQTQREGTNPAAHLTSRAEGPR